MSDGYYDQIKFGLISDQDISLKSGYGYIPEGETSPRPATVLNSKFSNKWYTLNVFTFTNLGNNNWQVDVTGRLWYASGTVDGVSKGSGTVTGTFTYTASGEGATLTGYVGSGDSVVVPALLGGLPVVAVAEGAFAGANVSSVVLPATVENIASGTFPGCKAVEYTVPNPNCVIAADAFSGTPAFSKNALVSSTEKRLRAV